MDKIIALYGGANVGKSTTFMELATMLPEPIDTLHWNKSDYRATFMVNGKKCASAHGVTTELNLIGILHISTRCSLILP